MNILIVCGGGASSSFIAQNVQKAGNKRGLDLDVDAISETELVDYAEGKEVVLAGPHLRYLEEEIKEVLKDFNVPYDFIAEGNYATMNGDAILDQAIELINK